MLWTRCHPQPDLHQGRNYLSRHPIDVRAELRSAYGSTHRTKTEHLATILLPNPLAAYGTSRYVLDLRRQNPQRKQDLAELGATG
jgi:hypothetical protein